MFNTKVSQATITCEFGVENKRLHMAICGRKYDPGKKASRKKTTPVKQKATEKKPTADQPTTPETEITEIRGDSDEQTQQDTDDELLYGSDDSLPNPFTPQDPKKFKTTDAKEDQDKEKADASTTAMDMEMPELTSNGDEVTPLQKQFTFKKPPLHKPPHK